MSLSAKERVEFERACRRSVCWPSWRHLELQAQPRATPACDGALRQALSLHTAM